MGGELRAYKIKRVVFLYSVGFLAATKQYTKESRNMVILKMICTIKYFNSIAQLLPANPVDSYP